MVSASGTMSMPMSEVPEFAQKIREQVLSGVKQGQQLSVDAAQAWVKAVAVLPTPDLPKLPGVPALPSVQAYSKFGFDVAADLLNAQRDFTLQLAGVLVPEQSV
jgi:hypothetical protein